MSMRYRWRAGATWRHALAGAGLSLAFAALPVAAEMTQVTPSSTAQTLDLQRLLSHMQVSDPQLLGARAGADAGREQKLRARSGFYPKIDAAWNRDRRNVRTGALEDSEGAVSNTTSWSRQIMLTQPLFNWDIWASYQQADLQAMRAQLQVEQSELELMVRATTAYFDLLMAEDELALARAYEASLREQLGTANRRFKAGEATLTDIRDIEAVLGRAAVEVVAAQSNLSNKRRVVESLYGRSVTGLARLPEGIAVPGLAPADVDFWLEQARASNLDIQLKEIDRKIASQETSRAKGTYMPTVTLSAGYRGQRSDQEYSRSRTTGSLTLQVNIPIFSGFETQHRVGQSLALEEKAAQELQAAQRKSEDAVYESFTLARTGHERIRSLDALVGAARSALEANRIGYRVGNRSESDLLQRSNQLWAAQRDLLRARYETLVHSIRLKALTASLRQEDIAQVNTLLAP